MESSTNINIQESKEPYLFSFVYFLILVNNITGAMINLPITILSCIIFIGIPGVVWIFVFFRRFADSLKMPLSATVIIINDILAIVYNYFILQITLDNFSSMGFDHINIFPFNNIVLLIINIVMQLTLKTQWRMNKQPESNIGKEINNYNKDEQFK